MNYIGSKYSLLGFLDESIGKIVTKECGVFCDLFAGTGIVGTYFKKRGYRIISNDIQYYSYALNKAYIGINNIDLFENFEKELPFLRGVSKKQRVTKILRYLNEMTPQEGYIYKNYCYGGTQNTDNPRMYFSDENGKKCDTIRKVIEKWKFENLINNNDYFYLLASLLEAIDKVANTASVYGAFLKKLKKSAQKTLEMRPIEIVESDYNNEIFNTDINDLIKHISGDILYLDPPYNQRQYAANYHILETIALYDDPSIFGKTGLRDYKEQRSLYCQKNKVREVFEDLISTAKFKYIFLSYNNEGLMSLEDIKNIMGKYGEYGYFTKEYSRFKADKDKNRKYKSNTTTEYLHYLKKI